MRVAIAGAGAVGRSIASELLENGHEVLLIDQSPRSIKADSLPGAEWLLADACEISSLDEAALDRCNVVIAATGDDKVNLVVSLLAKTEYGCSTSRGAWMWRSRRHGCYRRSSRRRSASAISSG
jgi:trk system potassium uptake protein TrkA